MKIPGKFFFKLTTRANAVETESETAQRPAPFQLSCMHLTWDRVLAALHRVSD